jgi:hypothetical protein
MLGNSPRYPLYRRTGRCGEEKNLLPMPGIETLFFGRSARFLEAISTELSWIQEHEMEHVISELGTSNKSGRGISIHSNVE